MVLDVKGKDQDVFNLFREADSTGVQVLFIRNGRLLGTDFFFLKTAAKHPLIIYWGRHCIEFICRKVQLFPVKYYCHLSIQIENCLKMHSIKNRNGAFTLFVLRKDGKKNLSQMAYNNAKVNLSEERRRYAKNTNILKHVKYKLKLNRLPEVVEAFDISHLSGTMTVASMVCWKNNSASNKDYRKYKIKSISGPDDFASMKEVLTRRYKRTLAEGKNFRT